MSKKILMIIAPTDYRNEEYDRPREIFEQNGYNVTVASMGVTEATGSLGGSASVDIDIAEVIPSEYDAVVFVGGPGSKVYFDNQTAHNIAKEMVTLEKVVTAICIAPSILANAGILNGKKATAFSSEESKLTGKGAAYTGDNVTVDGRLVTANGPKAAKEFGEKIIELLERK